MTQMLEDLANDHGDDTLEDVMHELDAVERRSVRQAMAEG